MRQKSAHTADRFDEDLCAGMNQPVVLVGRFPPHPPQSEVDRDVRVSGFPGSSARVLNNTRNEKVLMRSVEN